MTTYHSFSHLVSFCFWLGYFFFFFSLDYFPFGSLFSVVGTDEKIWYQKIKGLKEFLIKLVKNDLIFSKVVTSIKNREKFLVRLVFKVVTSVKRERGLKKFLVELIKTKLIFSKVGTSVKIKKG